jgi:hypothetical protein
MARGFAGGDISLHVLDVFEGEATDEPRTQQRLSLS